MDFKLRSIPEGQARGWTATVNGVPQVVNEITLNSKFGVLHYGLRPEGYDAWVFREQAGGGAVTLPYTILPHGCLFVALVKEQRANMGEKPVWCAIGGFVDPGENHAQAQEREAREESGLNTRRAHQLLGENTNPNRAFFVADLSAHEGVHAYGIHIPSSELEYDGKDLVLKQSSSPLVKKGDVKFFSWKEAIMITGNALARSAIAQLLVEVH